jgi:hypothetical protein
MLSDEQIAQLSAADKLALAQRLLAALGRDMGAPQAKPADTPMSSAELSAMQASLHTQVLGALSADAAATDWNAVRKQMLDRP